MITADRLRELVFYDPATGVFTWRVNRRGPARIGSVAGTKTKFGVNICIDCGMYRASRLAWLYMTGAWPTKEVIPFDGDPYNLEWSNLREATASQRRAHASSPNNRAGARGVYQTDEGSIYAQIHVNRKVIYLGCFDTIEAASAAYQKAAREYFGEFARVA